MQDPRSNSARASIRQRLVCPDSHGQGAMRPVRSQEGCHSPMINAAHAGPGLKAASSSRYQPTPWGLRSAILAFLTCNERKILDIEADIWVKI